MTLFVRDLPTDLDDREIQEEFADLPLLKSEISDHAFKVESAQKHLRDMEEHAESVRAAAEQRVTNAREALLAATQAQAEIKSKRGKVLRTMVMRKGDQCNAFVRFESRDSAKKALDEIKDGTVRIGGRSIVADMARTNTNP